MGAPRVGLILGSGLDRVAQGLTSATDVPFGEVPGMPSPSVAGHRGILRSGAWNGLPVIAMLGRLHLYEGLTPAEITLPVRILQGLGAEILVTTNAAGAINPSLQPGELMLVRDHLYLPGLVGVHPLVGVADEEGRSRFVDMVNAYDEDLRAAARDAAQRLRMNLSEGVYAMVAGPSYETAAEAAFLRSLGADVVGMSTVPEVVVARYLNMRVCALSVISNVAAQTGPSQTSHEQVLETVKQAADQLRELIGEMLGSLT